MNTEKERVSIAVKEEYLIQGSIDDLIEMLQEKKKEGIESFWIYDKTDRWGDSEGIHIEYYKSRLETDEEFYERLRKEKINEERRIKEENEKKIRDKEKELKTIEEEKKKLEELIQKYPELMKKK